MGEGPDDGGPIVDSQLPANVSSAARGNQVTLVDRQVEDGDLVGSYLFLHEVALYGLRASHEMSLARVPAPRGESMDVSHSRGPAEPLEPPAPPTGARQVGVDKRRPHFSSRHGQTERGQQIGFPSDPEPLDVDPLGPHLLNYLAAARDDTAMGDRPVGRMEQQPR
jgi:hypothetical protein